MVAEICPENRYDLIFDEKIDGPPLEAVFREKENVIVEIDEDELSEEDANDET